MRLTFFAVFLFLAVAIFPFLLPDNYYRPKYAEIHDGMSMAEVHDVLGVPTEPLDALMRSMQPYYSHSVWASAYGGYAKLTGSSDIGSSRVGRVANPALGSPAAIRSTEFTAAVSAKKMASILARSAICATST